MNVARLVVGLVFLLSVFALLGSGLVHQIAPAPGSVRIYDNGWSSWASLQGTVSQSFSPTMDVASYTGFTMGFRSSTSFGTSATINAQVTCSGKVIHVVSGAQRGVERSGTWITFPTDPGVQFALKKGDACSVSASTTGSPYDVQYATPALGVSLIVWGVPPPAVPPSSPPAPPASPATTSTTIADTTTPPPPSRASVDLVGTAATAAAIILTVLAAIFILSGIFD